MKRVSIRDVAREAGVSTATVSYVLNPSSKETISTQTADRVRDAVMRLGYVPNLNARQLSGQKSGMIGIFLPTEADSDALSLSNPLHADLIRSIEAEANRLGWQVMLCCLRAEGSLFTAVQRALDGIIVLSSPAALSLDSLNLAMPVVHVLPEKSQPNWITLEVSDRKGGRLAGAHFLSKGHRRIAFIGGPQESLCMQQRLQGCQDALAGHALSIPKSLQFFGPDSFDFGKNTAETLGRNVSSIFCGSDLIALGAIAGLRRQGLTVPRDVSVIGFGDTGSARWTSPGLTSIHADLREMGTLAVQTLRNELDGLLTEKHQIMPLALTARGTVRERNPYDV